MLLTSSKLLKAQMGGGGRQRRGQFAQCLSWNIHLPSTSGSQTLRPWHGFAALASLVLRLLHLDCNYTTGFFMSLQLADGKSLLRSPNIISAFLGVRVLPCDCCPAAHSQAPIHSFILHPTLRLSHHSWNSCWLCERPAVKRSVRPLK